MSPQGLPYSTSAARSSTSCPRTPSLERLERPRAFPEMCRESSPVAKAGAKRSLEDSRGDTSTLSSSPAAKRPKTQNDKLSSGFAEGDAPAAQEGPPAEGSDSCQRKMSIGAPTAEEQAAMEKMMQQKLAYAEEQREPPPENSKFSKLEHLAQTGKFDVKSHEMSLFYKDHPKGSEARKDYGASSIDVKRQIREAWGRKHFGTQLESMEREDVYSEVDTTKGEYLTFGSTVIAYGGWHWKPAINGAQETWEKIMKLGGKWLRKDTFSGLTFGLILKKEYTEILERKWKQFENMSEGKNDKRAPMQEVPAAEEEAGEAEASGQAKPKATAKGKAKGQAKPKAKAKPKAIGAGEAEESPGKGNKLKAMTSEAMKAKTLYSSTMEVANHLKNRIESNAVGYSWANNEQNLGQLKISMDNIVSKLTDAQKDWLTTSLADMKSNMTNEQLVKELQAFMNMSPAVQKLKDRIATMQKQVKLQKKM